MGFEGWFLWVLTPRLHSSNLHSHVGIQWNAHRILSVWGVASESTVLTCSPEMLISDFGYWSVYILLDSAFLGCSSLSSGPTCRHRTSTTITAWTGFTPAWFPHPTLVSPPKALPWRQSDAACSSVFSRCHVTGTIPQGAFGAWLLSLSCMPVRPTQTTICQQFAPSYCCITLTCVDTSSFLYSVTSGRT